MDWALLFSTSGATIVVSIVILTIIVLFIVFHERFRGVIFGYKDMRIEVPRIESTIPTTLERTEQITKSAVEETAEEEKPQYPLALLFESVSKQDREGIEHAFEELRKDPPAWLTAHELDSYKSFQLLSAGFRDGLAGLQKLEQDRPDEHYASEFLARYYLSIRSLDDATQHLKLAEQRARTDSDRTNLAILAAEITEVETDKIAAAQLLLDKLPHVENNHQRARLYAEAGRLYREAKKQTLAALNLEQALGLNPEDTESRFSLALLYGEVPGLKHLAFRHYRVLLQQNHNHTGALNNIALLYEQFGIPSKGIELLKRATDRNDGHALGNLAATYLAAGFIEEAKKIISDASPAVQQTDRVVSVQGNIQRSSDEASQKVEKVRSDADKIWLRFHEFPIVEPANTSNYSGNWKQADGSATLKIDENVVTYITYVSGSRTQYGLTFPFESITTVSTGSAPFTDRPSSLLVASFDERPNQLVLLLARIKFAQCFSRKTHLLRSSIS